MRYLTFTLSLLVLPTMGSVHHSQAEFASEVQEIEAEIVEIAWRNPHPVLTVSVANDAGEPELWEVESWSSANSLIVTTRNTNYPYFDDDGTAKSDAMEIDERFTLGTDGNTLSWEAALMDPVYPAEPVVMRKSWEWVPGEDVKAYDCLESSFGIER